MGEERREIFFGRVVLPESAVPQSTLSTELQRVNDMLQNLQNATGKHQVSDQYTRLVDTAINLQAAIETHGPNYSLAEYLGLSDPR